MVAQMITLEDIKKRSLEELFREVAEGTTHLIVQMPDGGQVIIESRRRLKALPVLEGYVPEGWKDTVYAHK